MISKALIFLSMLVILSLNACTTNDASETSPALQAEELAFYGVFVGSSMADVIQQFGEPSLIIEATDIPEAESIDLHYADDFFFVISNQQVIAYFIEEAAAGFKPLGLGIVDSWVESIVRLEQVGLPFIEVSSVSDDTDTYRLSPNMVYLLDGTTIMVTTEKIEPTLIIFFDDNHAISSFQVS